MLQLNLANDVGYGSVKAVVNETGVQMPSVMAVQRRQDLYDPMTFDSEAEQTAYVQSLLQHLDVSIQSPAVKTSGRLLVGEAAIESQLQLTQFDVNDWSGKSETDLSLILTLSLVAGKAVQDSYAQTHTLPSQVDVNVNMTTALPVMEAKKNNAAELYRQRYMAQNHVVTLHNFREIIVVRIHFAQVVVAFEGETAEYELMHASEPVAQALKQDFDHHYPDLANELSARELVTAQNELGIDIGEGTTDLVLFNDGRLNPQASSSLHVGYGNALEAAVRELQGEQFNIADRTALKEFVSKKASILMRSRQEVAKRAIDNQLTQLADRIVLGFSEALSHASAMIEVVFVYGGGATPMDAYLREKLMAKTRNFNNGHDIPVVWVPQRYAQFMNQTGLKLILDRLLMAQRQGGEQA